MVVDPARPERLVLWAEPGGASPSATLGWILTPVAAITFVFGLLLVFTKPGIALALVATSPTALVVGWRLASAGVTVTHAGISFRRVFATELVPVERIRHIDVEPTSTSQVGYLFGPYRDCERAVVVTDDGRRLDSQVLVGGTKRRSFNTAPSSDLLRDRLERIAAILRLTLGPSDEPTNTRYRRQMDRVFATNARVTIDPPA